MISYSYEDVLIRESRARRQLKARLIKQLAVKEKAMDKKKCIYNTEAGCNIQEVSRTIDLTQHRTRACQIHQDAVRCGNTALEDQDYVLYDYWEIIEDACRDLIDMLDARNNAKDAST